MITLELTLAEYQSLAADLEAGRQAVNVKLSQAVGKYQAEVQAQKQANEEEL